MGSPSVLLLAGGGVQTLEREIGGENNNDNNIILDKTITDCPGFFL